SSAVRAPAVDLRAAVSGGDAMAASSGAVDGASRLARAMGLQTRRVAHLHDGATVVDGHGRAGPADRASGWTGGLRSSDGPHTRRDWRTATGSRRPRRAIVRVRPSDQ